MKLSGILVLLVIFCLFSDSVNGLTLNVIVTRRVRRNQIFLDRSRCATAGGEFMISLGPRTCEDGRCFRRLSWRCVVPDTTEAATEGTTAEMTEAANEGTAAGAAEMTTAQVSNVLHRKVMRHAHVSS